MRHGPRLTFAVLAACACAASGVPPPADPALSHEAPHENGSVRADSFRSQALGTDKRFLVYLPPSYATNDGDRYPVAYYLHGLWGSEDDWVSQGRLAHVADSLVRSGVAEMIVVMPDGDDGWYTTWNSLGNNSSCRRNPPEHEPAESYCVPWPHYDDYIARDLVAYVDSNYRTLAGRAHRGIAGLSMGGYGAVTLALAYPAVFSAAASHSGVLTPLLAGPDGQRARSMQELRVASGNLWPSMKLAFGDDTAGWIARDPARLARRLSRSAAGMSPVPAAIFVDVGLDDRFLAQNRAFRAELLKLGMQVKYAEWPGGHGWDYWRAHVDESLAWLASEIGK
ncbi:MAG: alpha/beta hydrolase [Gemmatimonadaceae bacterium]